MFWLIGLWTQVARAEWSNGRHGLSLRIVRNVGISARADRELKKYCCHKHVIEFVQYLQRDFNWLRENNRENNKEYD